MPSFNSLDLGDYVKMKTRPNRYDIQLTSYPGVDGLAALALGSRGYVTTAEVGATGATLADIGAVAATWYSAVSAAVGGDLIDSYGITWHNVVIVDFYPLDEPGPLMAPGFSGYGQMFYFEFLHLA